MRFCIAIFLLNCILAVIADPGQHLIDLTQASLSDQDRILHTHNGDLSFIFPNGPRDYYTLLLITSTLPQHSCSDCEEMKKVIGRVARSWFADHSDSHMLYFVDIDLIDQSNRPIFNHLKIETVPHVWLIPPTKKNEDVSKFDLATNERYIYNAPAEETALKLAQFLSQNTQKNILLRQEDQLYKFIQTFAITFGSIVLLKKRGPRIFQNLQKSNAYTIIVLAILMACIGGYSFTTIQGVPFISSGDNGDIIYISGGVHYQFGVEIFLVGATYTGLTIAIATLLYFGNYKVSPKSRFIDSEPKKTSMVLLNVLVIYLLYSCLTSLYLRKDHGYPYSFMKLF
ncbi:dolichyl-diphosphooligosaccharide--protein glycosyltransferase subunit Ost6p [[Candida] anglica]|uniref:Dolichyl-diphosphooligosaccharide--protein glycosyltransferase subunit Ost6p n=1 Tax=[Candida] anglica TaxID=148631 RepID=A0ABP0EEA9_9ASCO